MAVAYFMYTKHGNCHKKHTLLSISDLNQRKAFLKLCLLAKCHNLKQQKELLP